MEANKHFEDIVAHSNICSTGQVRNSNITTTYQYIRDGYLSNSLVIHLDNCTTASI